MIILKFQSEIENTVAQYEEAEAKSSTLSKQLASLESQINDVQESMLEETRQKLSAQTKYKHAEEKCDILQDQLEEKDYMYRTLEQKASNSQTQIIELKKKMEILVTEAEGSEDIRKKLQREIDALNQRIEQLTAENDKSNKSKKKLQSEVEDLSVEIDTLRSSMISLEKKQKKYDQNLEQERSISHELVSLIIIIILIYLKLLIN